MSDLSSLWADAPAVREGLKYIRYSLPEGLSSWEEVAKLGAANIERLLEEARFHTADYSEHKFVAGHSARVLAGLLEQVRGEPHKPYLIHLRPHQYFRAGTPVVILVANFRDRLVDADWIEGVVEQDYEFGINYKTTFRVHDGDTFGGFGGGQGSRNPAAMTRRDYDALRLAQRDDPDFLDLWLRAYDWSRSPVTRECYVELLAANRLMTGPAPDAAGPDAPPELGNS